MQQTPKVPRSAPRVFSACLPRSCRTRSTSNNPWRREGSRRQQPVSAIAHALNALFDPEHEVVALREKFHPNISDEEWITLLSAEGRWIVVSGDRRITRNKAEYAAFRNSRLIGFFLARGLYKAKVTKQAERLLALWDRMETLAATVEGGAMFELQIKSNLIRQLRL